MLKFIMFTLGFLLILYNVSGYNIKGYFKANITECNATISMLPEYLSADITYLVYENRTISKYRKGYYVLGSKTVFLLNGCDLNTTIHESIHYYTKSIAHDLNFKILYTETIRHI